MAPAHGLVLPTLLLLAARAAALPYSASSPVVSLDPSNLKAKLKSGPALVEFYAPWCGHCKALTPEWEKAAKAMKGSITVAAVDADAHKELAQEYGIQGFPTIKFMYLEGDKVKATDYQGGRTAKDFIQYAFDKAKSLALKRIGEKAGGGGGSSGKGSKAGSAGPGAGADAAFYSGTDVVTLTESNFADQVVGSKDLWFVEFYAPWCGHCKNLKPTWIEAAAELKGKVKFGAVDCTVHQSVCGQYDVKGYPTIKWFGGSKSSPDDYQGGRDSGSITQFARNQWAQQAPPPEVRQLVDQSVWEQECVGGGAAGAPAKQLCFIAFLPDILDSKAAGRKAYLSTLKKLADKFKDRPFSYLWAQGGSQPELEANLEVGGFGYPAVVAFKPGDAKYSLARGAFELNHLVDFVEGIRKGREAVLAVKGSLADLRSTPAWDGKDAAVQVEDEFSLDDLNEL
ncbi:thioredoxin-like protein [Haematococcus lacustris]